MRSTHLLLVVTAVCGSVACSEGPRLVPPDTGVPGPDTSTNEDVTSDLVAIEDAAMMGMDATVEEDSGTGVDDTGVRTDTGVVRDTGVPRDVISGPVDLVVRVGSAPADAPDRFTGAEVPAIAAPEIVYPQNGTVIPPNLRGFEYQVRGPAGATLYEITFRGGNGRVRVYSPCVAVGGGCAISINDEAMAGLAVASAGAEMQVSVRATTAAGIGRATAATLGVSGSDIRGGVYYWTVEGVANAIMRYEWGAGMGRSEQFIAGNAFACVGCHSLSRDGSRIAIGVGIPGPSVMTTYDTLSRATVGAAYGANFATFSPDNTRLLTSNGSVFAPINPATGTAVTGFPAGQSGTQPDWSPDGRSVVYSIPTGAIPIGSPGHGAPASLQIIGYDPAMSRFTGSRPLLPSMGENNYYPHFAPDSDWVIFNRSSGQSSSAPDARLWAIRASTGGAPVEFNIANSTGNLVNSWPRWAPFRDTYNGDAIYWFTFSSHRDYGLRLRNSAAMNATAQLWMAAFKISEGVARRDPSTPAFWLPFQSISGSNHIAQWTERVQRRTCGADMECAPGERCISLMTAGGMRCVGGT